MESEEVSTKLVISFLVDMDLYHLAEDQLLVAHGLGPYHRSQQVHGGQIDARTG